MTEYALSLSDLRYELRGVHERGLLPVEILASPRLYFRLLAASYYSGASCDGLHRVDHVLHFFEVPIRPGTADCVPLTLHLSNGTTVMMDVDETAAVVV